MVIVVIIEILVIMVITDNKNKIISRNKDKNNMKNRDRKSKIILRNAQNIIMFGVVVME